MGDPSEVAPSKAVWGRGKWELQVFFALANTLGEPLSVYDFHTHVYQSSGIEHPLAAMIHRARVELTQDNSVISGGASLRLEIGEVQHVKLVLESSLYDTLMTTIVFGLFADYHQIGKAGVSLGRVASDKVYVFQHWHRWGPTKCHLVERDEGSIASRLAEDPANKALRKFCRMLDESLREHRRLGEQQPVECELVPIQA